MNREIKFRAWDKKSKHIWNWDNLKKGINLNGFFDSKNFEIMQFTGKKDKTKKEIYEGDIIKVTEHPDFPVFGGIGYVFWDKEELCYYWGNEGYACDLLDQLTDKMIEVMGNIYENPELLNDTNQEVEE